MTKTTFSVAAIAATMLLGSVAANADYLGGGPMRNADGTQCATYTRGNAREGRFGVWGACPQVASARTTTTRARNGQARGQAAPSAPAQSAPRSTEFRENHSGN